MPDSSAEIRAAARCIRRDGGRLFADTPVNGIVEQGGQAVISTATGATVRAGSAIVATNAPINDWIAIHTKQAPYRTYVLAARVPRGTVPACARAWARSCPSAKLSVTWPTRLVVTELPPRSTTE